MLLTIKDLSVYYGVIQALKGINFSVDKGEIVALIGANGAGKTTTLHTISGLIEPKAGEILFNGTDISRVPGHKRVALGLSQVPEGRRVFADMTVEDNLRMGAYTRKDKGEIASTMEMVFDRFPRLKERRGQVSGTLSGGEQQMLAVARALMCKPKVLMMDEPSLGLAPLVVKDIFGIIRQINDQGVTVLLIEQNANMALKIADYAYVLETGSIGLSGTGKELLENDAVRKAYLGN